MIRVFIVAEVRLYREGIAAFLMYSFSRAGSPQHGTLFAAALFYLYPRRSPLTGPPAMCA